VAGKHDTEGSQEPGKLDRSLSIEEAAQVLGCSARTVRRRIKDGSLQAFERPIPRGFEWRILLEKLPENGRQTAEEGRQEPGKLANEGRQEPVMLDTLEEPPGEAEDSKNDNVQLATEAEEPAHFDNNVTEVADGQPQETPAPVTSDNVTTSAEPALLKALELIETLQREHRQEIERLQHENTENYGRASFFQAKLQDAQERILMLEARPAEEEHKAEPEPEKPSGSWWRRLLRRG